MAIGPGFDPIAEARRQWVAHGWVDAADGMALVTSVMRVNQILLSIVDGVLRPYELTFARFEILALLDFSRRGSLPLGKIGDRLQVHPTSASSAVQRLERQGLIIRVPHPTDGRTTLVEITSQGRKVVRRAAADLNATVFADLPLGRDDVTRMVELLTTLRRNSGDL
ncbi:MAG: MarR family transcriptional regulator [Acidimicrobiaceae bacterium]|nr:MarR family transcriptional regulator [Acidimicrobiaceae bacterium]MBO0748598.1 MarR family transcriptional regulator [Acidimicrobiaceae bacterium]